jgi:ADP-ribose pyrophosphatase YjhB (NUDIX family)
MSHEIKIHEAQTSILRELLFVPDGGFAELQKPTGLTSDHFTFHINRLLEIGLVERTGRGRYQLTIKGKEYANRLDTDERTVERQAKLAVMILPVRRRDDGSEELLIQKRLKQPFFGWYACMTGKLRWGETAVAGAARELKEETGLEADLTITTIYHKLDYTTEGELLEDKHFYVVRAEQVRGNFTKQFDGGENYWFTPEEIATLSPAFSGIDAVAEWVHAASFQFVEKVFRYDPREY